jgi:protein-disulfide isomerase
MSTGEAHLAVPVGPADHVVGRDDAPITLVEYGDYECSYCGTAFVIVNDLRAAFGDSVRFVFRNMPLVDAHPNAEHAAEAAEAVALQGKFWPMHDRLYEHQDDLGDASLLRYAHEVGADPDEVARVLESGVARQRVIDDFDGGVRSGVQGTPTFFVNGLRYEESWELGPFREHLQAVLGQL